MPGTPPPPPHVQDRLIVVYSDSVRTHRARELAVKSLVALCDQSNPDSALEAEFAGAAQSLRDLAATARSEQIPARFVLADLAPKTYVRAQYTLPVNTLCELRDDLGEVFLVIIVKLASMGTMLQLKRSVFWSERGRAVLLDGPELMSRSGKRKIETHFETRPFPHPHPRPHRSLPPGASDPLPQYMHLAPQLPFPRGERGGRLVVRTTLDPSESMDPQGVTTLFGIPEFAPDVNYDHVAVYDQAMGLEVGLAVGHHGAICGRLHGLTAHWWDTVGLRAWLRDKKRRVVAGDLLDGRLALVTAANPHRRRSRPRRMGRRTDRRTDRNPSRDRSPSRSQSPSQSRDRSPGGGRNKDNKNKDRGQDRDPDGDPDRDLYRDLGGSRSGRRRGRNLTVLLWDLASARVLDRVELNPGEVRQPYRSVHVKFCRSGLVVVVGGEHKSDLHIIPRTCLSFSRTLSKSAVVHHPKARHNELKLDVAPIVTACTGGACCSDPRLPRLKKPCVVLRLCNWRAEVFYDEYDDK
jgi:hypothetical protein